MDPFRVRLRQAIRDRFPRPLARGNKRPFSAAERINGPFYFSAPEMRAAQFRSERRFEIEFERLNGFQNNVEMEMRG